ncbi:IS30 family transposase [Cryobacterium breve]|uniref:IS30 family transposase n=2 Tax=Cryobacterium breve TaxID=1259258 RepID=A0ABY2IZE9_9MICO|nr:IS30 family transposase [Cryobacterium breve]TFC93291.1 IS30 family transposase [Cryobacterium sp. TmT3-12]TFC98012.1 IS30 family transposase [Cryobacterium breve]
MAFFTARASGASLRKSAALAGISRSTACLWLKQSGGVRPRATKPRPALRLSLDERETISRGLAARRSLTAIAAELGRPVSTVSREVLRNSGRNGYRAAHAERLAEARSRRPRLGKLASDDRLREHVESKLRVCWSPQQISKRLITEFPDDLGMRVSHETIYTSLFVQAQLGLRAELTAKLRTRRLRRHPQRHVASGGKRSRIPGLVPLKDRPAEANDRKTPGHWEGDMIVGRYSTSHIVALVERHSRALIAVPLPHGAKSEIVIAALIDTFNKLPAPMRRTLTWDRGNEMARHADFTTATGIPVFFCDAYSPWQRGTNENTNGLLRKYLPKSTDLNLTDTARLEEIVAELNNRPRRTLGWQTPHEVFSAACVALTA